MKPPSPVTSPAPKTPARASSVAGSTFNPPRSVCAIPVARHASALGRRPVATSNRSADTAAPDFKWTTTADPAETARGYIHDFHGGALKLVGDRERGVLIGATLVSPRAGEILGELVLAVKLGIPLKTLADVIHPFPAFNRVLGESLAELAAKASQAGP